MDWYALFKFLHIVSAIIWLGGGFVTVIMAHAADRTQQDEKLVDVVRQVAWCAERIFVPASLSTLAFGVAATWYGALWSELWVILALVGVAATLALGIGVLSPKAKRVAAPSVGVTPETVATSRQIVAIAKFDMVLLFTIVADMVLKPQPGDWPVLVLMATVVIAGGFWFLGRLRQPAVATT